MRPTRRGWSRRCCRGYGQPRADDAAAAAVGRPDVAGEGRRRSTHLFPTTRSRLAKAKAELAASAYPKGFTASVTFPDAHPELGKALLVLAQDLKHIGITLNVKQIPISQWLNTLYTHPKPMGMQVGNWSVDYPDPARRAVADLPERERDEELVQHRELQEPEDGRADRRTEPVGRPGDTRRRHQAGASARRDRRPYIPLWYQDFAVASTPSTRTRVSAPGTSTSRGPRTSRPSKVTAPARRARAEAMSFPPGQVRRPPAGAMVWC